MPGQGERRRRRGSREPETDPSATLRDITDLLGRCPAFAGVTDERIGGLARDAEIAYIPDGADVAGDLARRPLVVQRGALVVHDTTGRRVDLVAPGEFVAAPEGHRLVASAPSMLVLLPDEAGDLVWSRGPLGVIDDVDADVDVDVSAAAVHDVMGRPVHTIGPDATCREAAELMRRHRISSLVVTGGEPGTGRPSDPDAPPEVGIVTLRDLRDRLVAEGRSTDLPVREVASVPARTIAPQVRVGEALVMMLAENLHHLPVAQDGVVVGMVTGNDLLRAQTRSPLFLLRALDRAADHAELAGAVAGLPRTVATLLSTGTSAAQISRIISTVSDRTIGKLLAFALADGAPVAGGDHDGRRPPVRWLVLGSQARAEQTLHSDQDTALLLPAGLDRPAQEWARQLAERITGELVGLGQRRCPGGVMATEPAWRMDVTGWRRRLARWVEEPSEVDVLHAEIAFDLREIAPAGLSAKAGSATTAVDPAAPPTGRDLHAADVAQVADASLFLARLARETLRHRPPLGFMGRFVVERSGDNAGTLDLKSGALLPIMNVARLHALSVGATVLTTRERLRAAVDAGVLSADLATVLTEGHELGQRIRLEQQVAALAEGAPPGNHVDPASLSPLVRSELREVFKAVRTAQDAIESRWHTGPLG